MRLHNLTMWDFKGLVGGPHVVNFQDATLLCGPNGYGKTTIFEALELCLTGEISRLKTNILAKTEDARSVFHSKSPLHNSSKPFVLELEFSKNGVIYTVRLKKEMSGNERLSDYCNNIELYLKRSDGPYEKYDRGSVDETGLHDLSNTYRLSTFISQDDASYFLRRRQQERHKDLSALTDTNEQHEMLSKLDKYHKTLSGHYRKLDQSVNAISLKNSTSSPTIEYIKILAGRDDVPLFDTKYPYDKIPYLELDTTHSLNMENVRELEKFSSTFKLEEYNNYKKYRYLVEPIQDDNFMNSLALSFAQDRHPDILSRPKMMHSIQREMILENKLKFYFVRSIINEQTLPEYQEAYLSYNQYSDIVFNPDSTTREQKSAENIVKGLVTGKSVIKDKLFENAVQLWAQYSALRESADNYTKLIGSLISARQELSLHQQKLDNHLKQKATSCVYCGNDWKTNQDLIDAYGRQEEHLRKIAKGDGERLSKLITAMQDQIITPLRERIEHLTAKHDTYAYSYSSQRSIMSLDKTIDDMATAVPYFVEKYKPIKEPLKAEAFQQEFNKMREGLLNSLIKEETDFYTFTRRIAENGHDISAYKLAIHKADFNPKTFDDLVPSIESFSHAVKSLREEVGSFAGKFKYDHSVVSAENLTTLRKYFNDNIEGLAKTLLDMNKNIPNKLAYLAEQLIIAQNKNYATLKGQRDKLKIYKDKIVNILSKCQFELRSYENSVTKSLQIPFYIISARVLQNSPHGEGGLVIKPQGNDSSKSLIIDVPGETQDAINQLSSGQLMVVSLAFFLALNLQARDNGAKLLLIDDPVQDMDALNSHALIDVLRREFTGADDNYQLVASTSSDVQMNLMKYKMHLSSDSVLKVQQLFFG